MTEEQENKDIQPESFGVEGGGTQISVASGGGEQAAIELPDALPVLPLKNTVLFPYLLSPLLVNTDRSRKLIDSVLLTPQRLLVCVAVKGDVAESPGPQDLYRVGTVMRIAKMMKFPDDSYRLLVQGVARVRILVLEFFVLSQPSENCALGRHVLSTADVPQARPIRQLLADKVGYLLGE